MSSIKCHDSGTLVIVTTSVYAHVLQWQVAAGALTVLHQLLSTHQVESENFADQLIDLQTGMCSTYFLQQ